jgi:hypothetical protein
MIWRAEQYGYVEEVTRFRSCDTCCYDIAGKESGTIARVGMTLRGGSQVLLQESSRRYKSYLVPLTLMASTQSLQI